MKLPIERQPSRGESAAGDGANVQLMQETLEERLSRMRGRRVHIRNLRRDSSSRKSSFQTERLCVTTDDDREPELRIYFKDLHPEHQVARSWALRSLDREPNRREIQMYESVLSRERFGTPEFYGARWEPDGGRCWLFIEDVGNDWLKSHHDFASYVDAARWAARFHAATGHLAFDPPAFLPVCDENHYWRTAEGIEKVLHRLNTADGDVVRRGLDYFTDRIQFLTMLPRSVIHRQFFADNIMLRPSPNTRNFAVIDWETAAVGPGVFDLVSISSNLPAEQRIAMWQAYHHEYQAETGQPLKWERFQQECFAVGVNYALEWLVWWSEYPELIRKFFRFVRELGDLLDQSRGIAAS